jgi:KaiC/GvpD/RAD55 family RecA-like ATPase
MQELARQKMPTGITSLDPMLDGGVPPGSVILLLGESGAGNNEFVYSSIVNLLTLMKGPTRPGIFVPKKIRYVTFTRLMEDLKREIVQSFHIEGLGDSVNTIHFCDLSELYFDSSIVPDEWFSPSDTITRLRKKGDREDIFLRLKEVLGAKENDSLIILDSVTDIAAQHTTPNLWNNFTGFLRGLQRISKQRSSTIYLLMSKGILDSAKEQEISDIADAVLLFKWEESQGSRRQRVMYIEKFRGVMPHLEERDLVKFAVRISTTGGFEVSNIRVVI